MSLAAPWALVGLVVLPLLWWLHRRRRRPHVADVPSLLFLEEEPSVRPSRRRAFDPELWLTLAVALLLVVAAVGPRHEERPAGRVVRVVVSGGAPAAARGYRERVQALLDRIRGALEAGDRLDVVEEPPPPAADRPRPTPATLLQTAQAGRASRRVVVSDRAEPAESPDGVAWVAVGDPGSSNAGLVAAALRPVAGEVEVFVNVAAAGGDRRPLAVRVTGVVDGRDRRVSVPTSEGGGNASLTIRVPGLEATSTLELVREDGSAWTDDLALDDRAAWERRPLEVAWGPRLPDAHRQAVGLALLAVLGGDGLGAGDGEPELYVTVAGDGSSADVPWRLVLHPARRGADVHVCPAGIDAGRGDPLARDLSTAGVDLHYAALPPAPVPEASVQLWRESGGRRWPVVARDGGDLHFVPDPLLGTPSPQVSSIWPLFVDNLVGVLRGTPSAHGWGHRRRGLLDAESTRLGREASTFDLGTLEGAPQDLAATYHSYARPLVVAALVALALLWGLTWVQVRRTRRRPSPVPSQP